MPIEIRWYDPDNILLVEYSRSLSVDEINTGRERVIRYLDEAKHPVDIIADWRMATTTPIRYSMRPRILDLLHHPNMGVVAIVGVNAVLAFWAELYNKRGGLRYIALNSVEEAARTLPQMSKDRGYQPARR